MPKLIAFEPIRKKTRNCCAYYLDYMSGHFQTHSHIKENTLNLYHKNVSFPQSVYLPVGSTGKEEGLWLFNISVNVDRLKLVISSERLALKANIRSCLLGINNQQNCKACFKIKAWRLNGLHFVSNKLKSQLATRMCSYCMIFLFK